MRTVFNVITGLASLLSFGVSAVLAYMAFKQNPSTDVKDVMILMAGSSSAMAVAVTVMFI